LSVSGTYMYYTWKYAYSVKEKLSIVSEANHVLVQMYKGFCINISITKCAFEF